MWKFEFRNCHSEKSTSVMRHSDKKKKRREIVPYTKEKSLIVVKISSCEFWNFRCINISIIFLMLLMLFLIPKIIKIIGLKKYVFFWIVQCIKRQIGFTVKFAWSKMKTYFYIINNENNKRNQNFILFEIKMNFL